MGNKRVRTILDLIRFEFDLEVACQKCGRAAWFDAKEVQAYLQGRGVLLAGYPPPLVFTCRCGCREMRFGFGPVDARPRPLPARKVGLLPIYVRDGR